MSYDFAGFDRSEADANARSEAQDGAWEPIGDSGGSRPVGPRRFATEDPEAQVGTSEAASSMVEDASSEEANSPAARAALAKLESAKQLAAAQAAEESEEAEEFRSQVSVLLDKLIRRLGNLERNEVYECCGVTVSQWYILAELRKYGPLTMSQLAERMGLAPSTITRVLDNLVKNGYVYRERSESDRRLVQVSLTGIGEGVTERLEEHTDRYMNTILLQIPESRKHEVYRVLKLLSDVIDNCGCC